MTTSRETPRYRAESMMWRHIEAQVSLPSIGYDGLDIREMINAERELWRLEASIADLEPVSPFALPDGAGGPPHPTPLGLVISEIGVWLANQAKAAEDAIDAAVPRDVSEAKARLSFLMRKAAEIAVDVELVRALADQYEAVAGPQ